MSSQRNCCVVNCHNTYKNSQGKVRFYSFPNKPWENLRKERWIQFVRRKNADGTTWMPKPHSLICSDHFVNNKKSNNPQSPSFNPMISPAIYKKKTTSNTANQRFERFSRRNKSKINAETLLQSSLTHENPVFNLQNSVESDNEISYVQNTETHFPESKTYAEISTQTEEEILGSSPFTVFISCTDGKEASTQVSHSRPKKNQASGPSYRTPIFFGYDSVQDSNDLFQDLCSVSPNVFSMFLNNLDINHRIHELRMKDKLLLTLMKLKLGITFSALGAIFGIHRSTASRYFYSVLIAIHALTKDWIFWPTKSVIQATMPNCFQLLYPNCRVIIDCTEIRTERPNGIEKQNFMYSSYKTGFTIKYLIGIAPNGLITFVSPGFGGRASDIHITNECGILKLLEKGDIVLADKGFPKITNTNGSIIIMPPFASGNGQFTEKEMEETYTVASVRIHVERVIQRLKIYNILNIRIPTELLPHMDTIVHVCAILTNCQPNIIKENE